MFKKIIIILLLIHMVASILFIFVYQDPYRYNPKQYSNDAAGRAELYSDIQKGIKETATRMNGMADKIEALHKALGNDVDLSDTRGHIDNLHDIAEEVENNKPKLQEFESIISNR